MAKDSDKKKFNIKDHLVVILLSTVIIILLLLAGSFFYLYKKEAVSNKTNEAEQLVNRVGKLINLPTDEVPTIATVNDKTKLQDQKVFKSAENGDKVLIYIKNSKAILYRPSVNKIIDVVPVNSTSPTPSAQKPDEPAQQANTTPGVIQKSSIILLNGTSTVGLTSKFESKLTSKYTDVEIIDKDNAGKNTYEETIVIDMSKKSSPKAKEISEFLKAELSSTLPQDEASKEADIIIILGKDSLQ